MRVEAPAGNKSGVSTGKSVFRGLWLMICVGFVSTGCASSAPTWHLSGSLWEAYQSRQTTSADFMPMKARTIAPERDLPIAPTIRSWWPSVYQGKGSLSIGKVNGGFLRQGARLPPTGPHHRATNDQLKRGTWEGSSEMVALILRAAEALVAARPGTQLEIANIARRGGGRIPWSVSHQNGRDADLLFPLLRDGSPYLPGKMIPLDASGQGVTGDGDIVELDVKALTSMVVFLVEQPEVEILFMFIANPLKAKVLSEARGQEVSERTLRRMDVLLRQPRGSLPHNDHLHLRIACASDDRLDGCRPVRSKKHSDKALNQRVKDLINMAREGEGERRRDALRALGWISPKNKAVRKLILDGLKSKDDLFRSTALESLQGFAGNDVDRSLSSWLRQQRSPEEILAALKVIEARTDRPWTRSLRILMKMDVVLPSPLVQVRRTSLSEAIWLAGVGGDLNLLEDIAALRSDARYGAAATKSAKRLVVPPRDAPVGALGDYLEEWLSMKPKLRREARAEHLISWGLIDGDGRVDARACRNAILEGVDPVFHAARRLLDKRQVKACRCPRWSRSDLNYYWRKRR